MRNYIEIKSSWFQTAGDKYGWVKEGLEVYGVGVLLSKLDEFKHLVLKIDGQEYYLDTGLAKLYISKYNSIFTTNSGYKVGVVSRSLLRKLG